MQTTSSAMIDDLIAVIGKHKSSFVGFYDEINELNDAQPNPPDGLQAIVLAPSEFYYHANGGRWEKFAPVGEVHPSYIGAYDSLADLRVAQPSPNDGDVAIIGKKKFYIFDSGTWDALISSTSGTESAQVTKNAADITKAKTDIAVNAKNYKDNKRRINQINAVLALTRATLSNLDPRPIFEYYGPTIPTLPNKPQSAYLLDVYALNQNEDLNLPYFADTPIRPGAMFFLANNDTNNAITLRPSGGETISGANAIGIPPGNVIALAKTSTGWQRLFSGFMASSIGTLLSTLRQRLADDLHTTNEIEAMINNWLANPTTHANLDKIMTALGYEKANSGTGPDPSTIRVHFGTGNNYPADFSNEVGEVAPHEDMLITGLNNNPRKVWVAVPQEMARKVRGISANDGLPARWPFTKADIDGKSWTIFQSPTELADARLNLDVIWRI